MLYPIVKANGNAVRLALVRVKGEEIGKSLNEFFIESFYDAFEVLIHCSLIVMQYIAG